MGSCISLYVFILSDERQSFALVEFKFEMEPSQVMVQDIYRGRAYRFRIVTLTSRPLHGHHAVGNYFLPFHNMIAKFDVNSLQCGLLEPCRHVASN